MQEKKPGENYEDRIMKISSGGEAYDIYAPHITIFGYLGLNAMYDNMYIKHPDSKYAMFHWRYDTDTGKEIEDYEETKWTAIRLGAKALLNLTEDDGYFEDDREAYIRHSTSDIENFFNSNDQDE